eukprot:c5570_g1_i1.p1 GENE.c5570_g1_i1~~c5570_g1_i1.p1  ORF type:complete len:315 (-),score=105.14 c5570_g1_i1:160-1062(-)
MTVTKAQIDAADEKIQKLIKSRGGDGIIGLARNFRIIDVDKSGQLSKAEFRRAMELFRAGLTDLEVDALFEKYDSDKSGTISTDEYLRGIRGTISKTRKALVNRVFANMDADGSGELTVEDMKLNYNAKKNPDVVSGRKTEEQVLREFMDTFEGGGGEKGDGKITRQEWLDYYTGISANIDNDDYFLMMICNVWKFPYAPLGKIQNLIKLMQSKVKVLQKGYEGEEKTLIKQFRVIDTDNSGEVDVSEFKQCLVNMGILSPAADGEDNTAAELLFALFDEDASGALSYKEFAHAALNYEF